MTDVGSEEASSALAAAADREWEGMAGGDISRTLCNDCKGYICTGMGPPASSLPRLP